MFKFGFGLPSILNSGSAFSPLDLPNLILWLDASDTSTINGGTVANNDPVSLLADKSISGEDASEATITRQGLWSSDGYIQFDGSNDRLTNATETKAANRTIHFVIDMQSLATYKVFFSNHTSVGLAFSGVGGNSFICILNNVPATNNIAASINTKYILSYTWTTGGTNDLKAYLNGVFQNQFSTAGIAFTSLGYIIGEWYNGNYDSNFKFYETLKFGEVQSSENFDLVIDYLKSKHSIV